MFYTGACKCNHWTVKVHFSEQLCSINPRICDCEYCKINPSKIISDPRMKVDFIGDSISIRQNGDRLANFYHCGFCNQLLAVGCNIDDQLRGAVNSDLLYEAKQLGAPVQIQPRLLSADEKIERWSDLWGVFSGLR